MKDAEARKILKAVCEKLVMAYHEDADGTLTVREYTEEELRNKVAMGFFNF